MSSRCLSPFDTLCVASAGADGGQGGGGSGGGNIDRGAGVARPRAGYSTGGVHDLVASFTCCRQPGVMAWLGSVLLQGIRGDGVDEFISV